MGNHTRKSGNHGVRSGQLIYSGLVSITFRELSPRQIVDLVVRADLDGIEWGGDVHVPHGDAARAREVGSMTRQAGLTTPSYGSYYRLGLGEAEPFEEVLETAVSLGAPMVRVWAGGKGSADADAAYRKKVAAAAQRISEMAQQANVKVACEYHGNTLTDMAEAATRLLSEVGHENFGTYWQPLGLPVEQELEAIEAIRPRLAHVHVFHWGTDGRFALKEGEDVWTQYLRKIAEPPGDRYALLEFVRDDAPEAFREDAATLKRWLSGLAGQRV